MIAVRNGGMIEEIPGNMIVGTIVEMIDVGTEGMSRGARNRARNLGTTADEGSRPARSPRRKRYYSG